MLDDAKSIGGLCRLCIQRCLEDDPVDTPALGGLYRRLLVSASSRVSAAKLRQRWAIDCGTLQESRGRVLFRLSFILSRIM